MRMVYYSVSETGILGKENPSAPIRSRTDYLFGRSTTELQETRES